MPTVLMLSWEYPPYLVGGLSRHVYALSRELAAQGHQVHVLTRSAPGLPLQSVEGGVTVTRVQPYFQEPQDFRLWVTHLNFALMEAGAALLQQLDGPVVVHAHDWLVAHAAKGLKGLFHLPMVATIHATEHGRHGGIHDGGQQYINDVEWWLTYEAWRVVVCSQAMRAEVRNLFGLSDDKVAVIPNGIDLPGRAGGPPRTAFATPDERLVFHIGRLVPEKGAGVLIEALPLLLRRHPVRVVIAGKGPFEAELRRRAQTLGVADWVHFAGWVDDVTAQALYRHADVAVAPSTYEPFGIVALEAMAGGAPLVASDVGGLAEIVRHEQNGLKAAPGDPLSLAEHIDRLLTDRTLAARLAASARAEVEAHYTWASVAAQTSAVYADVIAECAASPWGSLRSLQCIPPPSGELPGRYTI
ncbi:MAG TPA: glycosyltransferase family 4 protein [Symbiobacteriaceae bacterium]|nr:glycosyltransferase family 4 protein [Symbiobacteriaceae bacterium]